MDWQGWFTVALTVAVLATLIDVKGMENVFFLM